MESPLQRIARDFAKAYPIINDSDRRRQKGLKASSIISEVLNGTPVKLVVDVGCSNAIFLDVVLQEIHADFGLGLDLDFSSLPRPVPNRAGIVGNALALPFSDDSIDLILCNHTYEHVPDSRRLFDEMRRVLKPNGIVFFSAMNSRWPIEPHYHIPFLHWLPKRWSAMILKRFGYRSGYLEQPLNTRELKELVSGFRVVDYTLKVIAAPARYLAGEVIPPKLSWLCYPIAKLLYGFLPGYLWVLIKPGAIGSRK